MIDPNKVIQDGEQEDKIRHNLYAEIARLRLTDAEREALEWAARETLFYDSEDHPEVVAHASTLRALLARHGGDA